MEQKRMNVRTKFAEYARHLDIDPIEAALMDIAREVQITQTMHNEAEAHYRGLASHVDRSGSPLHDMVAEIYASGSFAIHAATRSRLRTVNHDVDAVLELKCAPNSDPEQVLLALYQAIKGEPGSRYFDYPIEMNSRCITVTYPDGVTVDLMPVVRLEGKPERVATLFHFKPEGDERYHKEINPKGFADYFNDRVETSEIFRDQFDARRYLVDGETYVEMATRTSSETSAFALVRADTQPLPIYVPLDQKSPRVVALQLIKRFRDKRFRRHDNHRSRRKPPSVVMATAALDAGHMTDSLFDEVIAIARHMRRLIQRAEQYVELFEVRNPAHYPDIFTDRWPQTRSDQQLWASDLQMLIERLESLKQVGFVPALVRSTFDDLFGEGAGETALLAYHRAQSVQLENGALGMVPDGKLKPISASPGLAAPALGAGAAVATGLIRPARANTNMGGIVPDDNCW